MIKELIINLINFLEKKVLKSKKYNKYSLSQNSYWKDRHINNLFYNESLKKAFIGVLRI